MAHGVVDIRIFLSSTKLDLEAPRQDVIHYLGVLKSDILAMEAFGSDESKPVDYCLRKVDESDIFIGIYAERYGTIDEESGKSITELEYDHAYSMFRQGRLKALLIYQIDPKARWPLDYVERDPTALAKLQNFKKKLLKRHTITRFTDAEDLPFLILRDVIRKLDIGMAQPASLLAQKPVRLLSALQRPVGMEYYDERLARLFLGRDFESDAIVQQLLRHRLALLIGASGIGKTSLLYAGVMPRLRQLGWRVVIARPLQDPIENIRRTLWDQLFNDEIPKGFEISATIKSAAAALNKTKLLVIIDQFEDILVAPDPAVIERLTGQLLSIYNSAATNVRLLIAYRADAEGSVGTIWQKISGAAEGLPRTYLGPLSRNAALATLKGSFSALGLRFHPKSDDSEFLRTLLDDLETESKLNGYSGIYPPFIQMVLARFYAHSSNRRQINLDDYYNTGRSRGIIADFLLSQIQYLGDKAEMGKMLLIALVSSYGTKTQKTLPELARECDLVESRASQILNSLVDLRLVRKLKDVFEITHDFLAKIISQELATAEEREAKTFKALLSSRTQAYEATRAGLTSAEHLHIYRLRSKILCTDQEVRLLLHSHLAGNGPVEFWIKRYQGLTLQAWAQECTKESNETVRKAALRFLIKTGAPVTLLALAAEFSDWKNQHELSGYIERFANKQDLNLLLQLNRKKAEEIVRASRQAIACVLSAKDEVKLEMLADSKSKHLVETFETVALKVSEELNLSELHSWLTSKSRWRRLLAIIGLVKRGSRSDIAGLKNLSLQARSKSENAQAVTAVARLAIRFHETSLLNKLLVPSNRFVFERTLTAIDGPSHALKVANLAGLYEDYSTDVARAIRKCSTPADIKILRQLLTQSELDPPARELVYAICDHGGPEEFTFLFRLFQMTEEAIKFWNPLSVVNRVAGLATRKHVQMLMNVINRQEFWSYYHEDERPRPVVQLGNFENLYFLKRLAAVAFGRVARRTEWPIILKMLSHDYWVVRNAALRAVERVGKRTDILPLLNKSLARPTEENEGLIEALCILDRKESGRMAARSSR